MRKALTIAARAAIPIAILAGLIVIILALKPAPPERVLTLFVKNLHNRKCSTAYRYVAEEWKKNDPDVTELSDFKRNICTYTESAYSKIFVDPKNMKVQTIGRRSSIEYFLCTLPQGFIRRNCIRQQTVLVREGLKWRLISFDIRMHTEHDFSLERPEALVKPNSLWKHPAPVIQRNLKEGRNPRAAEKNNSAPTN